MRSRPDAQERAREMRREGASVKEIAAAVKASKSSVSGWVAGIEITPEQRERLDDRVRANGGRVGSYQARSERARSARRAAQLDGRRTAQEPNSLHLAGAMLYWAEGTKSRNSVIFTNSDPDMVAFFLEFLRRCYGVTDEKVALTVNCFVDNGLTLEEIETWWLAKLDLPRSCLRKASVNRPSRASKGVRAPLLHGTARIAVSSTFIVQSIYGAIQEYAGCERPEWLDLGVKGSGGCQTTAS
jgi:hypothetical protein